MISFSEEDLIEWYRCNETWYPYNIGMVWYGMVLVPILITVPILFLNDGRLLFRLGFETIDWQHRSSGVTSHFKGDKGEGGTQCVCVCVYYKP